MAHKELKFFLNYKESSIDRVLVKNHINIDEDTTETFTDSTWNNCVDTMGRRTRGNCTIIQGGPVDHSSPLSIPVAVMSAK